MISKDITIGILPGYVLDRRPQFKKPNAIILIRTDFTNSAYIPQKNCLGELRLCFPDLEGPVAGWEPHRLFSPSQANEIWNFLDTVSAVKVLVISCEAGVSRSPAVGAAISKVLGQDFESYFRNYHPNRLVYRIMLETWNENHQIQEPVVVPPQICDDLEGEIFNA